MLKTYSNYQGTQLELPQLSDRTHYWKVTEKNGAITLELHQLPYPAERFKNQYLRKIFATKKLGTKNFKDTILDKRVIGFETLNHEHITEIANEMYKHCFPTPHESLHKYHGRYS